MTQAKTNAKANANLPQQAELPPKNPEPIEALRQETNAELAARVRHSAANLEFLLKELSLRGVEVTAFIKKTPVRSIDLPATAALFKVGLSLKEVVEL